MPSIRIRAAPRRAIVELAGDELAPYLIEVGPTSARVALVAASALLLGADRVQISIDVGEGCCLFLDEIAGTVAQRAEGRRSEWSICAALARAATLVWSGRPFVVSDGAAVDRRTRIDLSEGARACLRETLVFGRAGETGGGLASFLTVTMSGEPVFVEALDVDPDRPQPGVLGAAKVLDSAMLFGERRPAEAAHQLLQLEEPGSIARNLAAEAHRAGLDELWSRWSRELEESAARRAPIGSRPPEHFVRCTDHQPAPNLSGGTNHAQIDTARARIGR